MKVAILGAGNIAGTMATTMKGIKDSTIVLYAVASRDKKKAEQFAKEYQIEKFYGSYEEMLQDDQIDLVYVATPHSHHYDHMKLCLNYGKHILCEKSFTINEKQAKEIFDLAKEKGVLVTEAIWTRYMPSRKMICDILTSGIIGKVHSLQANLGYELQNIERMIRPELAGGALLDLGVYPINFAMMIFGDNIKAMNSTAVMSEKGIDLMDSITLYWEDNKTAVLHATMMTPTDRRGVIFGEKGYLVVNNINNPESLEVYSGEHELLKKYEIPKQITGYEYEVYACAEAIKAGRLECEDMTHEQTLAVMKIMDAIREQWGMKFPMEL